MKVIYAPCVSGSEIALVTRKNALAMFAPQELSVFPKRKMCAKAHLIRIAFQSHVFVVPSAYHRSASGVVRIPKRTNVNCSYATIQRCMRVGFFYEGRHYNHPRGRNI